MSLVAGLQRARTTGGSAPLAIALLVAANLIPLVGVLFFGWDILTILVLYWVENGIVGAFNAARIARAAGEPEAGQPRGGLQVELRAEQRKAAYLVPFFIFHYGLFWVVHGFFVFLMPAFASDAAGAIYADFSFSAVALGAGALAISHGVSFVRNYIGRGEFRRVSPAAQFGEPYPRMIVLHLTILAGAWLLIGFGQPVLLVGLLVVLKTAVDLLLHLRRHGRLQATATAAGGG